MAIIVLVELLEDASLSPTFKKVVGSYKPFPHT